MRKIILASIVVLLAGGLAAALGGCRKTTAKSVDEVRSGTTTSGNAANSGPARPATKKAADKAATTDNPVAEQAEVQNKRAEYNEWLKKQYTNQSPDEDKENSK